MVNLFRPEFQQSLLRLGRLGMDFWFRTLMLSIYGAKGSGQRLYRLQNHCREKAMDGFLTMVNRGSGSEAGRESSQEFILECREAYLEEARNSGQVALITCEEMEVWFDSFCKEWRKLAESTLA